MAIDGDAMSDTIINGIHKQTSTQQFRGGVMDGMPYVWSMWFVTR